MSHSIRAARVGLAAVALTLLTPAGALAEPERLTGSRFIDVVGNNTLSGTTASGAAYNLYFLPGGQVTYEDATGARDRGHWSLDPQGDVCVRFATDRDARCFAVEMDGRNLTWSGKSGDGAATLRGGVTESFLKPQ